MLMNNALPTHATDYTYKHESIYREQFKSVDRESHTPYSHLNIIQQNHVVCVCAWEGNSIPDSKTWYYNIIRINRELWHNQENLASSMYTERYYSESTSRESRVLSLPANVFICAKLLISILKVYIHITILQKKNT